MAGVEFSRVAEAFNSMLRTDYISLKDIDKLTLLADYYVDYFGYLPQILTESDQLLVGRRGTGKTTLLYRALVECMRSWDNNISTCINPRTLGIYVDLSKCQALETTEDGDFAQFEHAFVSEVCDAIIEQMTRFWPELGKEPGLFMKLFKAAEAKQIQEVQSLLSRFAELLQSGLPRLVDRSGPVHIKEGQKSTLTQKSDLQGGLKGKEPNLQGGLSDSTEEVNSLERDYSTNTTYRLTLADVLRLLGNLKEKAGLSAIYLFIDEYSALSDALQRRFSTLLRKMLGTHAGVFVKLCVIRDKYTLGSSIILQRDLFEISLDLDSYVERSGTLNDAMDGLRDQAEAIVTSRLKAYSCPPPTDLFDGLLEDTWINLSRAAMGVPRTLGIVLQQAFSRAQMNSKIGRIRKSDISYGIQYASKAYLNQMLGASKDGVAIPQVVMDIYHALVERAQAERGKTKDPTDGASHFMVLPKHESMLKLLNMFFLVHLLTTGRTTKKEKVSRSLYCFDYGLCLDNNLGFASDKNIIRQQRFAYDEVLSPFERHFGIDSEPSYRCPTPGCGRTFKESSLFIAGEPIRFCPIHRSDLVLEGSGMDSKGYTEEETKILGAMRSATKEDQMVARRIADDVGCHVQKVARFGEKLEREGLIQREKDPGQERLIYFGTK